MKRVSIFTFVALVLANTANASIIIDTNGTWDGNVNSGWLGSGQSFTVPAGCTTFQDVGFYFDTAANGLTFTFQLNDAINGGNTLFSTNFVVNSAGINVITMNVALAAGQNVWAQIDYNGYSGASAHFSGIDGYSGGNSTFGPIGSQTDFPTLDHRFIATFVPEPSSMLMLTGVLGFALIRRQR